MKQPKYNNEGILMHCFNREPHSLIFDHDFINYRDFEVVALCEDLEKNFEYVNLLFQKTPLEPVSFHDKDGFKRQIDQRNDLQMSFEITSSLVWAALFFHHKDIVPEKYKVDE